MFMEKAPKQVKEIYQWFTPPSGFGEITGENIELTASGGDGGCSMKANYNYSLDTNYITIVKSCMFCTGDPSEQCTEF